MRNRDAEAEAEAVRWVSFVGGGWLRMKCPHFGGSLIAEAESRKRNRGSGSGSAGVEATLKSTASASLVRAVRSLTSLQKVSCTQSDHKPLMASSPDH